VCVKAKQSARLSLQLNLNRGGNARSMGGRLASRQFCIAKACLLRGLSAPFHPPTRRTFYPAFEPPLLQRPTTTLLRVCLFPTTRTRDTQRTYSCSTPLIVRLISHLLTPSSGKANSHHSRAACIMRRTTSADARHAQFRSIPVAGTYPGGT
jgi:hypothetical protein